MKILFIQKLLVLEIKNSKYAKTPQDQLYLDKSNLLFVPSKRKVLHNTNHKFIQNIITTEFCHKENNI